MGKLRKVVQRKIIDILDQSTFTSDDFELFFGDTDSGEFMVSINFIHDFDYQYQISVDELDYGSSFLTVTKKPGMLEESETQRVPDLETATNGIADWCKEVRNKLKAAMPIFKEMDELRDTLYEHLKGYDDSQEFSVAEINALKAKFEELNRRVDELEKTNVITESQSHEFKEGIEKVNADIEYYPKLTWLKTSSNKIAKLIANLGRSPEGRKILADSARKLIGLD